MITLIKNGGRRETTVWKSLRGIKSWATRRQYAYEMRGDALIVFTPEGDRFVYQQRRTPAAAPYDRKSL